VAILEAVERFDLHLRIHVLPIGHIQSPLSSMLIGEIRRDNLAVGNRRKITEATTCKNTADGVFRIRIICKWLCGSKSLIGVD
jgi:hypothetical protein